MLPIAFDIRNDRVLVCKWCILNSLDIGNILSTVQGQGDSGVGLVEQSFGSDFSGSSGHRVVFNGCQMGLAICVQAFVKCEK